MMIQAVGVIISVVVSLASLSIVLYKEFLQGYSLHSSLNQLIHLRMPGENKNSLLLDMLLFDFLSENPSRAARALLDNSSPLKAAAEGRDRERVKVELYAHLSKNPLDYAPPNGIMEQFFADLRFSPWFCVPLIVLNSGRKFAHIGSVLLIVQLKHDPTRRWVFNALVELDLRTLIPVPGRAITDAEQMSGIFFGFSIGQNESIRVCPVFVPLQDADNQIISREPLPIGHYKVQVLGYGEGNKVVFRSNIEDFSIDKQGLIDSFNGISRSGVFNDKHAAEAAKLAI